MLVVDLNYGVGKYIDGANKILKLMLKKELVLIGQLDIVILKSGMIMLKIL